jgi:hypothetical protein
MNKQILAAFTILIFALAITGYAYSTWLKTINVRGTVNMAGFAIYIQDYNITLTTLTPDMLPDNHTLTLTGNITQDQTLWTGIIIKNNGTTPVEITLSIKTNNPDIEPLFSNQTYFYGPYTTIPPEVWESATTMPPSGSLPTPPELPAQNMLVIWQNITLSETPPEPFAIEITVTYTATFASWTDKVNVIYTLTYPGET